MFQIHRAKFIGSNKEGVFVGSVAKDNFFLILEVEGLSQEKGQEVLKTIDQEFWQTEIKSLTQLEDFIGEQIRKTNLPGNISLASGFLMADIFFLRTVGGGEVRLGRDNQLVKIIDGDNSASGFVKTNDLLIFATNSFSQTLGEEVLRNIFKKRKPDEMVATIKNQLNDWDTQGLVALFILLAQKQQMAYERDVNPPVASPWSRFTDNLTNIYRNLRLESERSGRKKIFTLMIVVLILIILIWSVVLGYQRRAETQAKKKIEKVKEVISQKLNQAEELSFTDLPESLSLLVEAKQELEKLQQQMRGRQQKELAEIKKLIQNKENSVMKKEEKSYEEFLDLTLDNAKATGSKLYLYKDDLSILDRKNNRVYLLSLTKKSLNKRTLNSIKSASLLALYLDDLLVLADGDGIFKIDGDGGVKKVIDWDKEWGHIFDMVIYNGNIYLGDEEKDEIFKYLLAEDGYSSKVSYFGAGEAIDMGGANSMTIDGAIYIGFTDYIKKFTAGVRDGFNTSYPDHSAKLTKIFTSKDLNKVYAWDKEKAVVYVLEKSGAYEKQIKSEIFKKADDIVVYDKVIYILVGSKIYKINL